MTTLFRESDQQLSSYLMGFSYRGERDHVQGADIFSALIDLTQPKGPIQLRVKRPIHHHVEVFEAHEREQPADVNAVFVCGAGINRRVLFVREKLDLPITKRRPYDEAMVLKNAIVNNRTIDSDSAGQGTFAERVLALNKKLLRSIEGPQRTWWFTGLELDFLPSESVNLRLHFDGGIGKLLMKSSITCNGTELGSVFFSERAPE